MRILQLVQKPQRRGAETFAFLLSERLLRRGHDVRTVYLYAHDGEAALPLRPGDVCLEGSEASLLERVPGFHPGLLAATRRALRAFNPDVVQVNGARTVKYGALCKRFEGSPRWALVYRNIGDPRVWMRGARRWLYRSLLMPQLDGVVGVSARTLDTVRAFHDLDVPMVCIPRGIDPEMLIPDASREECRALLGAGSRTPLLIFVGSVTREKRIDRLLKLAVAVGPAVPDMQLWIVGDGPLRSELAGRAAAMGLGDRVRFLGALPNVATYLAAADLLILCSDTEGLPGVVLEAAWMAVPAVAFDVGGVSECIIDGETGVLVPAGDEVALQGSVQELLLDAERRLTLGLAARDWVATRFLIDEIADRYLEFYARVLAA